MATGRRDQAPAAWTVWAPLALGLFVVLALGTVVGLGIGFAVLTGCTNTYSCTSTGCPPCRVAGAWLTAGWAGQVALLAGGVALAVLATRGVRLRTVRRAAIALTPLSLGLSGVTTSLAVWAS